MAITKAPNRDIRTLSMTSPVERYFRTTRPLSAERRRWERYLTRLFEGTALRGRSVLDIGGGDGSISYYLAARGAKSVLCLEPGADGSNTEMEQASQRLRAALPELQVQRRRTFFQDLNPHEAQYDVIVIHNAINHFNEKACAVLRRDEAAREQYRAVFRHLAHLASPGADLIVADASRFSVFPLLGLRNPFAPTINWSIHQTPGIWASMLQECGFSDPIIRWTAPGRLGRVGQALLTNAVGAFLTSSHFILKMQRTR